MTILFHTLAATCSGNAPISPNKLGELVETSAPSLLFIISAYELSVFFFYLHCTERKERPQTYLSHLLITTQPEKGRVGLKPSSPCFRSSPSFNCIVLGINNKCKWLLEGLVDSITQCSTWPQSLCSWYSCQEIFFRTWFCLVNLLASSKFFHDSSSHLK
jgi:hypothetical protein